MSRTDIAFTTKFLDSAKKKVDGTPKPIWLFPIDDRLNSKAQVERLKSLMVQMEGCENPDIKGSEILVTIAEPILLEETDAVTFVTVVQTMNVILPHLVEERDAAHKVDDTVEVVGGNARTANSKPKTKQTK